MVFYPFQPVQAVKGAIRLLFSTTALCFITVDSLAQVLPGPGTNTQAPNPTGSQFEIQGGALHGQNLFHHFIQFSPQNQNVNFNLPNSTIQNVLSRVSGGDVSYINGLIKSTGGNANLFLINPAGIIFGNGARLDVPGSFTATTATRVKIGDNWLNAIGSNNYDSLLGTPSEFAFGTNNPGVIVNNGNLELKPGNSLSLVGGVVANTGTLSAPSGQILLQAVPGSSKVQMNLPGSPLILEFDGNDLPPNFTPQSLPQLLTGSIPIQGLQPAGNQVRVTASDRLASAAPGSAIVGGELYLPAQEPNSITLSGSSILLNPNSKSVRFNDNIQISSLGKVDIVGGIIIPLPSQTDPTPSVSTSQTPGISIRAKGDISISNCPSPDVCLESFRGKDVSIISQQGSITIPTINTSVGTGQTSNSLVKSPGSINLDAYGDIRAQNLWARDEDTNGAIPPAPSGIQVISRNGKVDLRGGLVDTGNSQKGQQNPGKQPYSEQSAPITIIAAKDVFTGEIDISSGQQGSLLKIISENGNIDTTEGSIFAFSKGGSANINLSAVNGDVALSEVRADGQSSGGNFQIDARNLIVTKTLDVGSPFGNPGAVTLNVTNSIQLPEQVNLNRANLISNKPLTTLATSANGSNINTGGGSISLGFASDYTLPANLSIFTNGGDIRLTSAGSLTIASDLNTSSLTANGGSIFLQSGSTIVTQNLITSGANNGGNVSVIAPTSITTQNIDTRGTTGNGGNVLLDPLQDVQFGWINTQAGAIGGNVNIVSIQGFVRGTNSFQASNGNNASISTIGGVGGGSITITHNGGNLFIPFNVTNFNQNGSIGSLTTGSETILTGIFPGPYRQGNIGLITSPRFTTLLADSLLDGNPRDKLTLETGGTLFPLEEKFTREFSQDAKVLTLEEMQSTLRRVEDGTGIKPALIYVNYASVPASMPETCTPGTMVKDEQNPGKMKECFCKEVKLPDNPTAWQENVVQFQPLPCDRLTLTLVTSTGAPTYIPLSKAPRHQVNHEAAKFRKLIIERAKKEDTEFNMSSRTLYDWLVTPLQEVLKSKGINNLSYLMPDRLRITPFSAMLDPQDQFLIETYSTGLMPSLSLVDTRKVEIKQRSVLAIGLSKFAADQGASPLNYTLTEIQDIPDRWNVKRIQNEDATFKTLQQEVSRGIIHFATHGAFTTKHPTGMIQLWDQKLIPEDMKTLNWYDSKKLAIELMILSACDTAYGNNVSELGFAGAAHRFGVKSVMGSLWKVDDSSTPELMSDFYKFLKTEPAKADALAKAQKSLINNNYSPFYWSAFTLMGNPW